MGAEELGLGCLVMLPVEISHRWGLVVGEERKRDPVPYPKPLSQSIIP